jgi:hypothetical protein
MKNSTTTEEHYSTTDYEKFHFLPKGWNRPIRPNRVAELIVAITTFGYIPSKLGSVWIDKDGVFDVRGQWYICKQKRIPFPYNFYTIPREKHLSPSEKRIIISNLVNRVNATQHSWQIADYINQHSVAGSKFYKEVVNFRDEYGYPEKASVACVCGSSKVSPKKITDGYEYSICQEYMGLNPRKEFVNIIEQCFMKIDYAKKEDWIFATVEFVKRYINDPKYKVWKKNLIDNCNTIEEQRKIKPYLVAFDNAAGIPKEKSGIFQINSFERKVIFERISPFFMPQKL